MRERVISRKRLVVQRAEPAAWSFPSAGSTVLLRVVNEGLRPLGRQSRGKVRSTVSPRTCNEGLRPLGRQARGGTYNSSRDLGRPRKRKKEKKNKSNINQSRPENARKPFLPY